MPSAKTMIGLGAPATWANAIGFTVAAKNGTGTAQVGGTPITTNITVLTAAAGQTAAVLPVVEPGAGPYIIFNSAATAVAALIYPPSGGTIQGGAGDAAFSVAQNKSVMFFKVSATGWIANLSA